MCIRDRTCVYLPYFLSWVIFAGLVQVFLQAPVPGDTGGMVNQLIVAMGGEAIDFMKRPDIFRGILVVTNIIKTAGYSTIIYLAAIAGVDPTDVYKRQVQSLGVVLCGEGFYGLPAGGDSRKDKIGCTGE